MSRAIAVRELDERHLPEWSRLVAASDEGSIYSTPEYLDILCAATGGRYRVIGAFAGDDLAGGIALYEEARPYGTVVYNRLLLYYNGVVLRAYDTCHPSERDGRRLAALAALVDHLSGLRHARFVLNCRNLLDARPFFRSPWSVRPTYTYVVPIEDLDAAWRRIDQNLRRLIKRAQSAALRFSEDDDFDAFFRLHHQVHTRKRAPLYLPEAVFRRFVEQLRAAGLGRLFHARLASGESAAAQLVLTGGHPVSHTVCAGADAAHLAVGATPFLRWEAFRRLRELGYAANDLTDASLNDVTRFKGQLGGDLAMNLAIARPDAAALTSYERSMRVYYATRSKAARVYHWFRPRRAEPPTA